MISVVVTAASDQSMIELETSAGIFSTELCFGSMSVGIFPLTGMSPPLHEDFAVFVVVIFKNFISPKLL